MKVVVNQQGKMKEEVKFPKLYRSLSTGVVVLFVNKTCGTVVAHVSRDEGVYALGYHTGCWWDTCLDTNVWTPFNGTITLSND